MLLKMLECGMKYKRSKNIIKRLLGKLMLKISVRKANQLEKKALRNVSGISWSQQDAKKMLEKIEAEITGGKHK